MKPPPNSPRGGGCAGWIGCTRSGIGATRFDQALAEAATLVDALPRNGRMLLMTSGRRALLRSD